MKSEGELGRCSVQNCCSVALSVNHCSHFQLVLFMATHAQMRSGGISWHLLRVGAPSPSHAGGRSCTQGRKEGRESQHGEPARIPGGGRSRSRWWLTRNRLKQLVRKQDVAPRVGSDPKQIVPSRAWAWLGKEKPALISSSTRGDWSCVPHLSRAQITWGVALGGAGGGRMSSLCVGEINFLSHPLQQCSWVMKCPNPACARHTNLSFSCPSMNAPGRGWILGAGIPCCRAWHGWTQCASQGTEPAPTLRTPFHLGNSAVAQAF